VLAGDHVHPPRPRCATVNSRRIGSPLSVQIDQSADYLALLFDQLGMSLP
jgi:hypothetical protein